MSNHWSLLSHPGQIVAVTICFLTWSRLTHQGSGHTFATILYYYIYSASFEVLSLKQNYKT